MPDRLVVVRGGGDLGSGVALRLWRCGFPVVILETTRPIAVRRAVAFSESIYDGTRKVEEAEARRAESAEGALRMVEERLIPVLVDPDAQTLETLQPVALVDAIMAKCNIGTCRTMAPFVIGLGPGFEASIDVHAVVETNRGPNLGRVIWNGAAEPDTEMPGPVRGVAAGRVVRAPADGSIRLASHIGAIVEAGEVLAYVDEQSVSAAFRGLVRGLVRDGLEVRKGMKIGDIDPRLDPALCRLVSDKALAVAGGVLEAIMIAELTT